MILYGQETGNLNGLSTEYGLLSKLQEKKLGLLNIIVLICHQLMEYLPLQDKYVENITLIKVEPARRKKKSFSKSSQLLIGKSCKFSKLSINWSSLYVMALVRVRKWRLKSTLFSMGISTEIEPGSLTTKLLCYHKLIMWLPFTTQNLAKTFVFKPARRWDKLHAKKICVSILQIP